MNVDELIKEGEKLSEHIDSDTQYLKTQKIIDELNDKLRSLCNNDVTTLGRFLKGDDAEILSMDVTISARLFKDMFIEIVSKSGVYRKRAIEAEKKIEDYEGIFNFVKEAYKKYRSKDHKRWDQRAKAFLNHFGLTNRKREEKPNKKWMFYEYMGLITGEIDLKALKFAKPVSKQKALEILKEKYAINSPEACLLQLRTYTREAKKNAEIRGDDIPCFKGILPGNPI